MNKRQIQKELKNNLNIFNQHYSPWRYIPNWPRNAKLFLRQFKWAYQRAVNGYADCDVWNLDYFLSNLMASSIYKLADITHGWPGTEDFPEFEDWVNYLNDVAMKLYQSNDDNDFYKNPYEDEFMESFSWNEFKDDEGNIYIESNHNDIRNKYITEEKNIAFKREQDFAEAWSMLGDYFHNLWD